MPRLLPLLFALAVALVGAQAQAETCTSNSSFNWSGVTAGDWAGCTASADDSFVIADTHTVTITGDVTQDTTAGADVTVNDGGHLRLRRTDGSAALHLTLGADGLTVSDGGTFTARGQFRDFDVSPAGLDDEPGADSWWFMGKVIPCPVPSGTGAEFSEPDCANSGTLGDGSEENKVMLEYAKEWYDNTVRGTDIDASLAAIEAGEDVLWVADRDQTDTWAPADDNDAFRITAADSSGAAYSLTMDPRQTSSGDPQDPADPNNPTTNPADLTNRDVLECDLGGDITRGQRAITLATGCWEADADNARQAHWAYFQDDNGEACADADDSVPCEVIQRSYLVQSTTDDGGSGGDTLTLFDSRGFHRALDISECGGTCKVWFLPMGWFPADPFLVISPVEILSATTTSNNDDSAVTYAGTTTTVGMIYENTGRVVRSGTYDDLGSREQYNWYLDMGSAAFVRTTFNQIPHTRPITTVNDIVLTGTNTEGTGNDDDNCFVVEQSQDDAQVVIERWTCKHAETGFGGTATAVADTTPRLTLRKIRSEQANTSADGTPASFVVSGSGTVVNVEGGVCLRCINENASATGLMFQAASIIDAKDIVFVGVNNLLNGLRGTDDGPVEMRDFLLSGLSMTASTSNLLGGMDEGWTIESGAIRDVDEGQIIQVISGESTYTMKKVLIKDWTSTGTPINLDTTFVLEDVLGIDINSGTATGTNRLVRFFTNIVTGRVERVTIALTTGFGAHDWDEVFRLGGDQDLVNLQDVVLSGFEGAAGNFVGADTTEFATCDDILAFRYDDVSGSGQSFNGNFNTACNVGDKYENIPMGLIDPITGRDYEPFAGGPADSVGVDLPRNVGLRRMSWPLWLVRGIPENGETFVSGGGGGVRGPFAF